MANRTSQVHNDPVWEGADMATWRKKAKNIAAVVLVAAGAAIGLYEGFREDDGSEYVTLHVEETDLSSAQPVQSASIDKDSEEISKAGLAFGEASWLIDNCGGSSFTEDYLSAKAIASNLDPALFNKSGEEGYDGLEKEATSKGIEDTCKEYLPQYVNSGTLSKQ